MMNPYSKRKWFVLLFFCLFIVRLTFVWLKPVGSPISVSIRHLGYTNGVGPHALLAITNRSDSAITLDSMGFVKCSPTSGVVLRRVTSIDPNKLRVTVLRPNEGFVQDMFVFPASHGEWQFECRAAYSSRWLEVRRFAENWLRKIFPKLRTPLTSKAWHAFDTEWLALPP
jgi:hypothetical protein